MFGDRAIYHNGWIASTTPPAGPWLLGLGKLPNVLDGYNWEFYDLTKDFSQFDDLAAKEPAKLKELQDLFLVEAAKYQVFPLDNRVATRFGQQPSATAGRDTFTSTGEPRVHQGRYFPNSGAETPRCTAPGSLIPTRAEPTLRRGFPSTVGRELRALGFRKLSARPRHYAQEPEAAEAFKKVSRSAWRRSEPSIRASA